MRRISLFSLGLLVFLFSIGFKPAAGAIAVDASPGRLADLSVDVIQSKASPKLENFLFIVCVGKAVSSLEKDGDAGAFVRHLKKVKGTSAVIATPLEAGKDVSYCVYFDGEKPIGIAVGGKDTKKTTDSDIGKSYTAIQGDVPRGKKRPVLVGGEIQTDDGVKVPAFQIQGWKELIVFDKSSVDSELPF